MGRIIETGDTAAKRRHGHLRSCAEALRLLAERPYIGDEEKDLLAFLVFTLRAVYADIDQSAQAWDDKGYWKKAEALRDAWRWSRAAAQALEALVRQGRWQDAPDQLIGLVPHFQGITIAAQTRDADWWCGAYRALLRERAA